VLAEFADAGWVWSALRSLGIATRKFETGGPRLASCLRITCPADSEGLVRLGAGLEAALRPRALLLDMDGVLADVGGSYRAAIVLTVESFGARVSVEEVRAAKMRPGSNNDWVVTQRLLGARGIEVPVDAIAAKFNEAYRGRDGAPGLEAADGLIPTRRLLERLAARVPLGIVTGRPRRDAETLLDRFNLRALFRTVVCMEDAPAKPDPAPITLALRNLGVRHAWMIGDTPDDVCAARAAGVIPLGIAAPSDDPLETRRQLASAGAARVLDSLEALEELLP
jgi:HAD superfamily hydrolase (TIGR01548 family)